MNNELKQRVTRHLAEKCMGWSGLWRCENPEVEHRYAEYVNGCPKCVPLIFSVHHSGWNPFDSAADAEALREKMRKDGWSWRLCCDLHAASSRRFQANFTQTPGVARSTYESEDEREACAMACARATGFPE